MKFETIRQKALLKASPCEVCQAYVDPLKQTEVTGSEASGSPMVGGRFTAWDGNISGKYLELEEGRKIVHDWKTTEWPKGYPASLVEITVTKKGGGTQLEMVHSKVPAEQADDYAEGWEEYYWKPLKKYFAKRE
ncbi:MAG: SRPBCC domain-containing protein [archaeon]|nr:MAG: SRPBCC domain-containing protein [archaeon]